MKSATSAEATAILENPKKARELMDIVDKMKREARAGKSVSDAHRTIKIGNKKILVGID